MLFKWIRYDCELGSNRVNYIPIRLWTMEEEGSKRIELIGKDDKRQITVLFAESLSGEFLPIQIIYQGKAQSVYQNLIFPTGGMSHTHQPLD